MSANAANLNAPDLDRLAGWMTTHVPGFLGPVIAELLAGGQSSPTFKLSAPSGDCVLRRKPMGTLLQSAHMVEREFKVIQALAGTGVPVPWVHALCRDDTVIGSAFYVMDFIPSRVFMDPRLPGLAASERAAIFNSMNATTARLNRMRCCIIRIKAANTPASSSRTSWRATACCAA